MKRNSVQPHQRQPHIRSHLIHTAEWLIFELSWVSARPMCTRQRNRKLVCKAAPQFISRQRYKVALYFVQFNWFNAVWLHKTSPEVVPCIDVIQFVRSVFGVSKAEHTENLNRNQNLEQVNGQIIKTSKWTRKVDSFDRSFGFSKSQVTCGVCVCASVCWHDSRNDVITMQYLVKIGHAHHHRMIQSLIRFLTLAPYLLHLIKVFCYHRCHHHANP